MTALGMMPCATSLGSRTSMMVISPEGDSVSGLSSEYLTGPRDCHAVSLENSRAVEPNVRDGIAGVASQDVRMAAPRTGVRRAGVATAARGKLAAARAATRAKDRPDMIGAGSGQGGRACLMKVRCGVVGRKEGRQNCWMRRLSIGMGMRAGRCVGAVKVA